MAEEEDKILGYLGIWMSPDSADLCNIAVAQEYRHMQLGQCLLREGISQAVARGAERMLLEVRESNEAAIKLYRHNGFEEISRRRGYYSKPTEDALLMQCLF